ncbi:MAG: ATP-binding cassette domain-containing protein [Phycisphaerales bacterium]|nr:ATP-binding cassette domain-containing protein [Phycisphaerales bacterium]
MVIDLDEVSKVYRGRVHALRGISMKVHKGEVFGLLGPNGAGKSTLVKVLTTVVRPTSCRGTMLGQPVGTKWVLGRVGYLPEHHKFPEYLTGAQVLDYYGALSGVRRRERRRRAEGLLRQVGISAWQKKKVKGYSKGMRQRLGIAQALMNDPDLVMLDEPTDGVDPVGRRDIRNMMVELREQGRTVFINSHLLSELEMICDRVAIIVKGVVAMQGTIQDLTDYGRRYEIEVELPQEGAGGTKGLQTLLRASGVRALGAGSTNDAMIGVETLAAPVLGLPVGANAVRGQLATGEAVVVSGSTIRIGTDDPAPIQPVIDAVRRAGLSIRAVKQMRPSLEDLFMRAVVDPETGQEFTPGAEVGRAKGKPGAQPTMGGRP